MQQILSIYLFLLRIFSNMYIIYICNLSQIYTYIIYILQIYISHICVKYIKKISIYKILVFFVSCAGTKIFLNFAGFLSLQRIYQFSTATSLFLTMQSAFIPFRHVRLAVRRLGCIHWCVSRMSCKDLHVSIKHCYLILNTNPPVKISAELR